MPRTPTWGTPGRSEHYQKLPPRFGLFGKSLATGALLFALAGLALLAGHRSPLSPGKLTSSHSGVEARCEACHAHQEALDLRCQRCHDGGGAGRLDLSAHVFFGSEDPQKASGAGTLACARCHVEHRGRERKLAGVEEGQCRVCHGVRDPAKAGQAFSIPRFSEHPEFKVLREKLQEDPRLLFSHKRHMKEMQKEGAHGEWDTCARCHAPDPKGKDLVAVDYERHCARCHSESELTMEVVPVADVRVDVGIPGGAGAFNRTAVTIQRIGIRHKDDWVLFNLRKLQWELYPAAYQRDRGSLLARADQLSRRLYQSTPLSGLDLSALKERETQVREELRRLEERRKDLPTQDPREATLVRLAGALAAARAAGERAPLQEATALERDAQALGPVASQVPLPALELEARRGELLSLLDAVQAADPRRERSVEDLRRRVLALVAGETSAAAVGRARVQRLRDLDRILDEISLRKTSVGVEARALPERLALQQELKDLQDQLGKYYTFQGLPPALTAADRARKAATLLGLTGAGAPPSGKSERCAKCHVLAEGSLLPQRAARSVMVKAVFTHKSHLEAPVPEHFVAVRPETTSGKSAPQTPAAAPSRCALCHEGLPSAGDAPRPPSVPGVASCRGCHGSGAAREDCLMCHRYHPPGAPS